MSAAQQRWLALWAVLLAAVLCLGFLPLSRSSAVLILTGFLGLVVVSWYFASRREVPDVIASLNNLPEAAYRQPVVLICGDLPQPWAETSQVMTVTQGCWIRVQDDQDLEHVARQILWLRPDWGRQLSVMVCVCPQRHNDTDVLTSRLLALRWQISQLRRETGHSIPLVLNGLVASSMMQELLWQAAVPGESVSVWRESVAPRSIAAWVTTGGAMAMQQQVLMNSLITWFGQYVKSAFIDENPDIPVIMPTAVLWGLTPSLSECPPVSLWSSWLTQHTALREVAGWQSDSAGLSTVSLLPDFVLPLLPEGTGLTPRQRACRCGLSMFTLAAAVALCSSGWNNSQLLHRLSFDIQHYDRISMDDYAPKAEAVNILRQDAMQLDHLARNGVPLRIGLGLYQGGLLRMPVLDAIRSYIPPPPPPPPEPEPEPEPVPTIIRLDSMSLFDSGKSELKEGSTKMLVNSLVGIKAKPGWLIVVAGHTDNTGNPTLNQALSLKRAEAVRDWMRDTGDVPESCFAVQGYGESRPVATNDTTEGRTLNRRVEISLVPQANACQIPDNPQASSLDGDADSNIME